MSIWKVRLKLWMLIHMMFFSCNYLNMSSMEQIKCTIYVNYPRIWSWTLHWECSQSTQNKMHHKFGKRKKSLIKWKSINYHQFTEMKHSQLTLYARAMNRWLTSLWFVPYTLTMLILLGVGWDDHLRTCLSHEIFHLLLTHLNRNRMAID